MRGKVEAQNMWGAGVIRYSLGTIDWPRSTMKELDRTTRRIMRQNQAHQYGASVARIYLPRIEGGRGLTRIEHIWEIETVTAAAYLHSNPDQQVRLAMYYREQLVDTSPNGLVAHALEIGGKYDLTNLLPGEGDEDEHLTPKKISSIVRASQRQTLREERSGRTIHGVFAAETNGPDCDKTATHAWLKRGSFRAETEGLLVAAQDGVIHTAAYRQRILKEKCDQVCRECGKEAETIGHILAACGQYKWSLYKTRHDGLLNVLVGAVAEVLGVRVPKNRWGGRRSVRSAVYGEKGTTILVDQCIPTKEEMGARRPDLVVRMPEKRTIIIMEVACAWEPIVKTREAQKKAKYGELAADLANQWPGYTIRNIPVVIGTLGLVAGARKALLGARLWEEKDVRKLVQDLQTKALCSAARILRRHLRVNRDP